MRSPKAVTRNSRSVSAQHQICRMNDRFRQCIREGEHHSQPVRIYGLKIGAFHCNRFAARMAELLEMAAMPDLTAAIEALLRVREGMRAERKAQDRTLAILSRHDQVTRRLMTIPGVGPVTALAFKATIDDVDRFATSKALGAHLGFDPARLSIG